MRLFCLLVRCLVIPAQNYQLMAERNVFQNQGLTRSQAGEDDVEHGINARFLFS